MKRMLLAGVAVTLLPGAGALGQTTTLASSMDVYVFPSDGQASSQQSKDEASCYDWAVTNSGNDPFDLTKQAQAQQQQSQEQMAAAEQTGRGAGVRGAVGGAAAGALIGEIASDDAGKGAAWGAAIGGVAARRRGRMAQREAVEQTAAQQQSQSQATVAEIDNFKKAFSVCLEAKKYMVKY